MTVVREQATVESLGEIVAAVASWQRDGAPVQLHNGDLGWNWRDGAEALAQGVQAWRRDGEILAVGMGDGDVVRIGISPTVNDDNHFADQLVRELSTPSEGLLPGGSGSVEARYGDALHSAFNRAGWTQGESWTPLMRSLREPVEDCGLRIVVVDADSAQTRVDVHRASFENAKFNLERWQTMAAGPAYQNARCLLAYDADDNAVAAATVWSAGEGRPGLIEPLGAHRDFRGHGHGKAITIAAAAMLQQMGASSVTVCTPTANTGGVAAYVSAGFVRQQDSCDFVRPAIAG